MDEASEVILELARAFPDRGEEALQALEHFDGQYVRAIGYSVKARARRRRRRRCCSSTSSATTRRRCGARRRDGPRACSSATPTPSWRVARDAAEAKRFWADRKRLGAIAARTNAFKLNEDIVLPLEALAEFSRWVDAVNLEEERENLAELARRLRDFFEQAPPPRTPEWLGGKLDRALALCEEALEALSWEGAEEMRGGAARLGAARRAARARARLPGARGRASRRSTRHVRSRLVVLATHMHAGDGNVHVNIPVMSNDRAMLRRAEAASSTGSWRRSPRSAAWCSGEHGIGVTKLKYLDAGAARGARRLPARASIPAA